jgi:hypothetical protein
MKQLFLTFLLTLTTGIAIAADHLLKDYTLAQAPDIIIINNDTFDLYSNPLNKLLKTKSRKQFLGFDCKNRMCTRGYVATWRIRNDSLFLVKINNCRFTCDTFQNVDLQKVFKTTEPFAKWVSGQLRIPKGKMIRFVPEGYKTLFEQDDMLIIKKGKLKQTKSIKHLKASRDYEWTTLSLRTLNNIEDTIFRNQIIKLRKDYQGSYKLKYDRNGFLKQVKVEISDSKFEKWLENLLYKGDCKKILKLLHPIDLAFLSPFRSFSLHVTFFLEPQTDNWKVNIDEIE